MLFFKECGNICKSIIYIAFVIFVFYFYYSQMGNAVSTDIEQYYSPNDPKFNNWAVSPLIKPEYDPNANYGYKEAEIPESVMPNAIYALKMEQLQNNFVTYPFGFGKNVKLNEKKLLEVNGIIEEITGRSAVELLDMITAGVQGEDPAKVNIPIAVDYETFKEKMGRVDKLLGGGSAYKPEMLFQFGKAPMTYEDVTVEYNQLINEDKISGGYARLYCDYIGIAVTMFAVFVPVAFLMRDKRGKTFDMVYYRKISSVKYICTRYFSVVIMVLIPVMLFSVFPLAELLPFAEKEGFAIDYLAFIKYITAWLLPTIMATTASGFFFTILFQNPIGIFIQFIYSFINLFLGMFHLYGGNYGIELNIRHNAVGNLQAMKDSMPALIANRVFYTVISIILVLLTVIIYDLKRREMFNGFGSIFKSFKLNKSADEADSAV